MVVSTAAHSAKRPPERYLRASRALWENEHFAVVELMFRKHIRTGFRLYLNFRVGKARLDCSNRVDFVGNGDKK